jgi:hypothetical protein
MYFVDYFYPGLFQKILDGESPAAPAQLQRRDRRQPVLALETAADYKPNTFEASVRITIEAKDGVQVRDVRLFRNHVLAHEWPGELRSVDGKLVLDAKIPLGTGRNVITVYAFNQDGIRSKQESMLLRAPVITPQPGRTVYVLAAGVNVYRDPAIAKLNYAASDAKLVTERIGGQGMRLALIAARIHPVLLTDAEATRERILTELRAIASAAKPFDAVLIYFSGHGMSDGERYHLLPHDALLSGDAAALKPVPNTTVSDADLAEALRPLQAGIAALVIDSCESGRALEASDDRRRGPINAHGFAQLAYEKGIQILAASQNGRSALELSELEQGLLTYALIKEGIGKALALRTPGEDDLALGEWFAYAADRVPELHAEKTGAPRSITMLGTNPTGGRQRPQLYVRKNLDAKLWLRVDQ